MLVRDASAQYTSEQWAARAVALAIEVGASEIVYEGYTGATTYGAVLDSHLKRNPPPHPVRVTAWRGRGDALARSAFLRQAFEVGEFRLAGVHPAFETAATIWQQGAHQPDCVAAAVIAHDTRSSTEITFGVPVGNVVELQAYLARQIG